MCILQIVAAGSSPLFVLKKVACKKSAKRMKSSWLVRGGGKYKYPQRDWRDYIMSEKVKTMTVGFAECQ
jgi:hypothetical protein